MTGGVGLWKDGEGEATVAFHHFKNNYPSLPTSLKENNKNIKTINQYFLKYFG